MMKIIRLAFCSLVLLALSSCATMNESECLQADWRMIGIEDGEAGRQMSYIGTRRKDCAEHGVTPHLEQYNVGRETGLKQFCTYTNGLRHGSNGKSHSTVCQGALQGPYAEGFNRGTEIYDMSSEINKMERLRRSKESELAGLNDQIRRTETKLLSRSGSRSARVSQLDHYNHLKADRDALQGYILDLESDTVQKRQQRDALRAEYSR